MRITKNQFAQTELIAEPIQLKQIKNIVQIILKLMYFLQFLI